MALPTRVNAAGQVSHVCVRGWFTAATLGKVLVAVGVCLDENGYAGLDDGVALLAERGWRGIIKGKTPEDLQRIGQRVAVAFPSMTAAADLVRRSKRFRDNGYVRE